MIRRASIGKLRRDRQGSATVEFALWSSLILGAMLPCLDFALYLLEQSRLSSAVGQASILAYNMRDGTVNVNTLTQYVSAASGLPSGTVTTTITCNGGLQSCSTASSSRICACPSSLTPITYLPTVACGVACGSGATSGYYLTVRGSYTHQSLVANPLLNGKAVANATTIRLQ